MRRSRFASMAFALASLCGFVAAAQEKPATPSLYDRLGGLYPISAVVDDFVDRVFVNATLNANPNVYRARSEVRKPGLKIQVATLVCAVTGGPCKYVGQDMKTTHKDFHITEKEWQALVADFKATLDKFKVPEPEQKELFAIVESTKPDIVESAATSK